MGYLLAVLKGAVLFNTLGSLFRLCPVIEAWGKAESLTQEKEF